MTEFEDRLRAAMESSVAAEYPSGNLIARVRRRHRRHLARAGVVWAAAAAAVAALLPSAGSALRGGGSAHAVPTAPASWPATARPGQYYGCDAQTEGALAADWRQGASHAGPLWIINAGIAPGFRFRNPDGTLKAVPLIVMLQGDTTVRVTPDAAAEPYFRFLPGFDDSGEYTLRDGQTGATFGGCSARSSLYGKGFTEFYIGVVVAGPRCVTLAVKTTQGRPPARTTLRFGHCAS